MKLFKRLSAIGVAVAMAATFATSVSAANRTAYSVGVKYYESASDTTAQDFSSGAQAAANAYAKLSDVKSVISKSPSETTLTNHINDNILFLDSHANYDRIVFRYKNSSGNFVQCGYRMGKDGTSNGVSFVGLDSHTMKNVELVTFVGCYTANENYGMNIAATAVNKGAKCSVGFKEQIYPTTSNGKGWISSYNNYLVSGYDVGRAIYEASRANPNSDLGEHVYVYGYGLDGITSKTVKTFEHSDGTNKIMSSDELLKSENDLFNFMKSYDNTFDSDKYKYYVNIFDKNSNTGIVVFNHYIGENIITNKSYIIFIENGYVADVSKSNTEKDIDENILIEQMNSFSVIQDIQTYDNESNIYETEEHFEYNYNTGELKYIRGDFSLGEFGEIINDTTELTIGTLR